MNKCIKVVVILILSLTISSATKQSPILILDIDFPENIPIDTPFDVGMTFISILDITSISYSLIKFGDIQVSLPDEWTDPYIGEPLNYTVNLTIPSGQVSGFTITYSSNYQSEAITWSSTRYFDINGSDVRVFGDDPSKLPQGVMQYTIEDNPQYYYQTNHTNQVNTPGLTSEEYRHTIGYPDEKIEYYKSTLDWIKLEELLSDQEYNEFKKSYIQQFTIYNYEYLGPLNQWDFEDYLVIAPPERYSALTNEVPHAVEQQLTGLVSVTLHPDEDYGEITWNIYDYNANDYVYDSFQGFEDDGTVAFNIALDDGYYDFDIVDTGENGGLLGEILVNGCQAVDIYMPFDEDYHYWGFEVSYYDSEDCGCTDWQAYSGYDPEALYDDGSCIYYGHDCEVPNYYGDENSGPITGSLDSQIDEHYYSVTLTDDWDNIFVSLCGSDEDFDSMLQILLPNCTSIQSINDGCSYNDWNGLISLEGSTFGSGFEFIVKISAAESSENYDYELNIWGEIDTPQTGENMEYSIPIIAFPYTDSRNTENFSHDYDAYCPFSSNAPDVVYRLIVNVNMVGIEVDISLCDSDFDSKIYLLDSSGSELYCEDDNCVNNSGGEFGPEFTYQFPNVGFYYLVVDGSWSDSDAGQYTLTISEGEIPNSDPNLTWYQPEGWGDILPVSMAPGVFIDELIIVNSVGYTSFAFTNDSDYNIETNFQNRLEHNQALGTVSNHNFYIDYILEAGAVDEIWDYAIQFPEIGLNYLSLYLDDFGQVLETDEFDNDIIDNLVEVGIGDSYVTISGQLSYEDPYPEDGIQYKPCRNLEFRIYDYSSGFPWYEITTEPGHLTENGMFPDDFTIPTLDYYEPEGSADIFFIFFASNEGGAVHNLNGNIYPLSSIQNVIEDVTPNSVVEFSGVTNDNIIFPGHEPAPFYIVDQLYESRQKWLDLTGSSLNPLFTNWPFDNPDHPEVSQYSLLWNELSIGLTDAYDKDVIAHEFGHYIASTFLFFNGPAYYLCDDPHTWWSWNTEWDVWKDLCIGAEAWGHFWSCVVNGVEFIDRDPNHIDVEFNIETGEFVGGGYTTFKKLWGGANTEGGVAGILWDIYDAQNDFNPWLNGIGGEHVIESFSDPNNLFTVFSQPFEINISTGLIEGANTLEEFWQSWFGESGFGQPSLGNHQDLWSIWHVNGEFWGDVNFDNVITVVDAQHIFDYILFGTEPSGPGYYSAGFMQIGDLRQTFITPLIPDIGADLSGDYSFIGDGAVDVLDGTRLVDIILDEDYYIEPPPAMTRSNNWVYMDINSNHDGSLERDGTESFTVNISNQNPIYILHAQIFGDFDSIIDVELGSDIEYMSVQYKLSQDKLSFIIYSENNDVIPIGDDVLCTITYIGNLGRNDKDISGFEYSALVYDKVELTFISSDEIEYSNIINNRIGLPESFNLSPAYPNPFNPVTNLNFDFPENGNVSLKVYDIQGREVYQLVDSYMEAGYHSIQWDATSVVSGVYIVKLVAGEFTAVQKVALVK
jgi:hypothetical protein